jgi:sulfur relay (sulfurtransferase) complex TusBCD TusD component (DsrE family)
MKIAILLKSGPCTDAAGRALQTADDMLAQGHDVGLYLLQEAVRFYQPRAQCSNIARLQDLIIKNLQVNALTHDAGLVVSTFPPPAQRFQGDLTKRGST